MTPRCEEASLLAKATDVENQRSCTKIPEDAPSTDHYAPEDTTTESSSFDFASIVKYVKYAYSLGVFGLCMSLIVCGIAANETPIAQATHPWVAMVVMWILVLWLGILEGGQGSLVGLQPINSESYKDSHPIAFRCTELAHSGNNLNRFIIGRQFFVCLVVFILNLCCTVVEDAVVPGFPPILVEIVLVSGLAVTLITVMLGQLAAEVNATNCMLDFINNTLVYITTWICLAIEDSGLLHSVYVVQYFFPYFTNKPLETAVTRTTAESVLYWSRMAFSVFLVVSSMAVAIAALLQDKTTMYEGLPNIVSVFVFFGLICFLGMLEAMQIALFAVVNLPKEALEGSPVAQANCKLAFRGNNFQAFLIGRQMCVTVSMFLLARITTTDVNPEVGETTVFGMSDALQVFFNSGLPGALITTVVASLAWRILAASFPVAFMANPLVCITLRLCLLLESSGVFSAAWLLADAVKFVTRLKHDTEYLGAMGQRGHEKNGDDSTATSLTGSSDPEFERISSMSTYGSTEIMVV